MGLGGDHDEALGNLDNVVAERLRHRVQGQCAVNESLNEFESAHCPLLIVIDDTKSFPDRGFHHACAPLLETAATDD
jgi:hypothetical protein